MKKIIPLIAVLLLVVAVLLVTRENKEVTSVDLLPDNLIGYIRQDKLTEIYQKYDSSRLGETVKGIDYSAIINDLDLPDDSRKSLEDLISTIRQTVSNPMVHEILGEHFVIALLANTTIYPQVSRIDNLKESLLLIAKPKRSAKALSLLAQLIPDSEEKGELEHEKKRIIFYRIDERFTVYATAIKDRILLSYSDTVIKAAISRYHEKAKGLSSNTAFTDAQKKHQGAVQFSFFQTEPLKQTILAFIQTYSPEDIDLISKELALFDNYSNIVSAVYPAHNDTIETHFSLVFRPEKLDKNLKKIILAPPEENSMVQMVPNDLLSYYWTNTFHLKDLYDFAVNERNITKDQAALLEKELTSATGLSLHELFALFDHKPTFVLKDSEVQFFLPVPDFGFYVRVNDTQKFEKMMHKLIQDNKIATHKKKYGEDVLTIWGEHSQNSMQLAYTIHDDYFVFASSKPFIEDIVSHLDKPIVFSQQNGLSQVTKGFHGKNNVLCYVQLRSFFKLLKEVVSWGGTVLAIQDRDAAMKSKIVIDRLVHPLLDGMSMYSALGYRAGRIDNTMTVDTVVQIDEVTE